ncbi:MAG: prolyl oligopeptidase family serine peptidase, partial [Bacteroidota bacterium]
VSFDQSYFGGAPWDDTEGNSFNMNYIRKSPLFEMEKVRTPTIIFHGSEDRAVPRDQGWEYYRALQQIGKAPVRFLWFPGQPHGLQKLTHQKRKMEEEIAWMDQYLFKTHQPKNAAVKEKSPLMALVEKNKSAVDPNGMFGEVVKGKCIPEVQTVKADSIAIARFELTNAQYKEYNKKHRFSPAHANHPAQLSKAQANSYVKWLSKLTGDTYRLPNEPEAKALHKKAKAVAGSENSLKHWAGYDITLDEVPMLREKLTTVNTSLVKAVGSFGVTKLGEAKVYDLGGNLREWCQGESDRYGFGAEDWADATGEGNFAKSQTAGLRVVKELK